MAKGEATTLSLERYARDAKAWIVSAQSLADERGHAEVAPLHLLFRGLTQSPAILEVFRCAQVTTAELRDAAERALAALPRGQGPAYLSARFLDLLARAERAAVRERAASIGLSHVLTALTQEVRGAAGDVLSAFGIGPGSLDGHLSALRSFSDRGFASVDPSHAEAPDLVRAARDGRGDPVVGRSAEILRLVTILERLEKSHPLIVGEPGVGKRAIVRGLAERMARGDVPARLREARIADVPAGLFSGARTRAEADERIRKVMEGNQGASLTILMIASIEQLFGGPLAAMLGDTLRGVVGPVVRLLATTTPEGVRLLSEKAPSLLRELTMLHVEEPAPAAAIEMVRGVAGKLERHHGVRIGDAAVIASVTLAKRYLPGRFLPDCAIDLLDESAASVRVEKGAVEGEISLEEQHVAGTLAVWTGIPVAKMLEAEAARLLQMEARLERRVVGQHEAVRAVSRAVRRGRVGLRDPRRPIGSFLFLGPSGVGKTELGKALAQFLFDDESALTRLDMSEFMERHMAQRLLGAPPGYADSEQGGFLTEAVRRRPYSVLLFDEVEKAHQDVFNLLLQVLDEGRLTDGRGRLADFTNTVVILTSNIGSARILETDSRLFDTADGREALRDVLLDELAKFFRPEFLNRIDDVVVFRPLSREDLSKIVDIQLEGVRALLEPRRVRLEVDAAAKERLVELGYRPALGARPLRRAILQNVQDPLAERLLGSDVGEDTVLRVRMEGDSFVLEAGVGA